MAIEQDEFDGLVDDFNADYVALLGRAARGDFDHLVALFIDLKDLYEALVALHDVGNIEFRRTIYPLTLRGNAEMLGHLGFGPEDIRAIACFFEFFRAEVGCELEDAAYGAR